MLLAKEGFDDELIIAGILHDTVEDIETITLGDIRREFGEQVAAIVEGCSEPQKKASWHVRKEHTINYLKTAPLDIKYVICADKLDNITSIARDYAADGEPRWERFNKGKEDHAWYYRSLVQSLATGEFRETALYRAFSLHFLFQDAH